MSLSNFLETALCNHLRGGTAYTQPTNLYVKLHLGDAGEAGTANAAAETTRIEVTFGAPSDGVMLNDAEVLWEAVSTTESYTHFSVWDDVSAGNNLGAGALGATVEITAGEDARFAVGALSWTFA
jgi:hypothetical protein